MSYREIINKLKPIEYSKYKDVTSNEKLMIYVASVLEKQNVPLTFNYICIATFKMFPDTFWCDEEFKEFPSIDRLNRTYMHLKYVPNGKPYIAGTMKSGFKITSVGKAVAQNVESIIKNGISDSTIKAPPVDMHKKGFDKDYVGFKENQGYKEYEMTGKIDLMKMWSFFGITPYTQIKKTKDNLNNILEYAKNMNDKEFAEYVEKILKML